ncbi:MAG: alpha/beta fold hydrolase [Flavicella sp.]
MVSLYKSAQRKKEILALYDTKMSSLGVRFSEEAVYTSFGTTHVIACGDDEKPPMILVHGSNGCAPIALETYKDLLGKYKLYAVDVLAQPNKSAETRLSMKDTSYGIWMQEVISGLGLQQVSLAGFSFGGLIILKTLEYQENNIKEVFLSSPAYIVNGNPLKALFKVFIPMKRFMKTEKVSYVEKFLAAVFTDRDAFAIAYLSKVFLYFTMDFTPVPVIKKSAAQSIQTPISIFAADDDIMFPGDKMMKRAQKIFPSLKKIELITGSKHVQNAKQNAQIAALIAAE